MPADLFPTKTRLALLEGIDRGEVTGFPSYGGGFVEYHWKHPEGGGQNVTARTIEQLGAGWLKKGPRSGPSIYSTFKPELTDAGRKVLEANSHG
jgi:hypothetical protein